ncbi:hypothetical protein CHARACLAT_009870 [Characodon lateralis]|uniref:Uncharacterized protein n=1 Tax=Characodon lateralis TaxID=208331 RepID=A0ABU7DPT6_9TELE|nr:hypothetical protein [Characodon lateralis]
MCQRWHANKTEPYTHVFLGTVPPCPTYSKSFFFYISVAAGGACHINLSKHRSSQQKLYKVFICVSALGSWQRFRKSLDRLWTNCNKKNQQRHTVKREAKSKEDKASERFSTKHSNNNTTFLI